MISKKFVIAGILSVLIFRGVFPYLFSASNRKSTDKESCVGEPAESGNDSVFRFRDFFSKLALAIKKFKEKTSSENDEDAQTLDNSVYHNDNPSNSETSKDHPNLDKKSNKISYTHDETSYDKVVYYNHQTGETNPNGKPRLPTNHDKYKESSNDCDSNKSDETLCASSKNDDIDISSQNDTNLHAIITEKSLKQGDTDEIIDNDEIQKIQSVNNYSDVFIKNDQNIPFNDFKESISSAEKNEISETYEKSRNNVDSNTVLGTLSMSSKKDKNCISLQRNINSSTKVTEQSLKKSDSTKIFNNENKEVIIFAENNRVLFMRNNNKSFYNSWE